MNNSDKGILIPFALGVITFLAWYFGYGQPIKNELVFFTSAILALTIIGSSVATLLILMFLDTPIMKQIRETEHRNVLGNAFRQCIFSATNFVVLSLISLEWQSQEITSLWAAFLIYTLIWFSSQNRLLVSIFQGTANLPAIKT